MKQEILSGYKYKVTYLDLGVIAFVRISDNAILYSNSNENYVISFASGYCDGICSKFYVD